MKILAKSKNAATKTVAKAAAPADKKVSKPAVIAAPAVPALASLEDTRTRLRGAIKANGVSQKAATKAGEPTKALQAKNDDLNIALDVISGIIAEDKKLARRSAKKATKTEAAPAKAAKANKSEKAEKSSKRDRKEVASEKPAKKDKERVRSGKSSKKKRKGNRD